MHAKKIIQLPESHLGHDRYAEVGYTYHGDVYFSFWNSSTTIDEESPPRNKKTFLMSHGSEVTMVAAMIGYYRRLGHSTEHVNEVFLEAAQPIVVDNPTAPYNDDFKSLGMGGLGYLTDGEEYRSLNVPLLNWEGLADPIPTQPGTIETVGGTGIYTRVDLFGEMTLLLAGIPSNSASEPVTIASYELCEADVPKVARAICELSMGEYREQLQELITTL